jgi:hypothetical protein
MIAAVFAAAAAALAASPAPADLGRLNAAVLAPDAAAAARAARPPGVATTSLESRFAGGRAGGAVGFLCGRPGSLDERAAASPLGVDPHGRFLGARLSLSFR